MLFDYKYRFFKNQSIVGTSNTRTTGADDTNTWAQATDARYRELRTGIGEGKPLALQGVIGTSLVGGTGITIIAQHSDDGTTWTDVARSPEIANSTLKAGTEIPYVILPKVVKRYVRAQVLRNGAITAGTITIGLMPLVS